MSGVKRAKAFFEPSGLTEEKIADQHINTRQGPPELIGYFLKITVASLLHSPLSPGFQDINFKRT